MLRQYIDLTVGTAICAGISATRYQEATNHLEKVIAHVQGSDHHPIYT